MRKYYLFFVSIILITIISGCETLVDVEYSVTGTTTKATMKIEIGDDGTYLIFHNENIPWSYEFQAGEGDPVYLWARNSQGFGHVTVTIYADEEVIDTDTSPEGSMGPFGVVSAWASGYLPWTFF